MIYYSYADSNGTDSIQYILDEHEGKQVVSHECKDFPSWEAWVNNLPIQKGDLFVLDTMTLFYEMVRNNRKVGVDITNLWEVRDKLTTDDYAKGQKDAVNLVVSKLKSIKARGANILTTAHEIETEEQVAARTAPSKRKNISFPPSSLAVFTGSSSDICRLRIVTSPEPVLGTERILEVGQRILEMGVDPEHVTKISLPPDQAYPAFISKPSYPRLCRALKKTPAWLIVYGPPGTGKSVFCLSSLIDPEGKGVGK